MLGLTKADLLKVFDVNPKAVRRIINAVLFQHKRKQRLTRLTMGCLIQVAEVGSGEWAALIVQRAWSRYVTKWMAEPIEFGDKGYTPSMRRADAKRKASLQEAVNTVPGSRRLSHSPGTLPAFDPAELEKEVSSDVHNLLNAMEERMQKTVKAEFDLIRAQLTLQV
jgi:hypothetical protein